MKVFRPVISLSFAVLGSILASPLWAATEPTPGVMHPVNAVQPRYESNEDIVPGLSDFVVVARLGAPGHEPSKDIWIYHNMVAKDDQTGGKHGCTNLVVTFRNRRVASLFLVNETVVQKIITQARANPVALPAVLSLAMK